MLKKRKVVKDVNLEIVTILRDIKNAIAQICRDSYIAGGPSKIQAIEPEAISVLNAKLSEKEIELRERIMSINQSKTSSSGEVRAQEVDSTELDEQLSALEEIE